MKHKLKKIIPSAFILIAFIIFSCSEDYEIHEHNHSKFRIKPISINDVISNQKAFEKLTNPKSRFKTNSTSDRIINDTVNNFSIETENGIFIEDGDYHSYTFKITRPNGSNFLLENVVVSKKNETEYETILYQYNITQQELGMIDNGEFVDLNGKINKILLENSIIVSEVTGKYYYNGSCYEDNPVYVAGQTCQGTGANNHTFEEVQSGQYCSQFGTINGPLPGYWTWQSTLVPCDDSGGGGTSSGSGQYGGGGSGGGSTTTTPVNNCRTCPPEFNPAPTPCQQLKNMNNRTVVLPSGNTQSVLQNLNDLTNNITTPKERGYFLEPDATQTLLIEHYYEGQPNSDEVEMDLDTLAVDIIMHTHYKMSQLPVFSLADLYQIYYSMTVGNIYSPTTFTSILVTAHGTKYALKITDPSAFLNWGNTFFYGWDLPLPAGTNNPLIDKSENQYSKYVNNNFSNTLNENGLAKFIQNLGIELYSANSNFSQWSKVTPNTNGTPTKTICP